MNLNQLHRRQYGFSTWYLLGGLLIIAGFTGLGIGLVGLENPSPSLAPATKGKVLSPSENAGAIQEAIRDKTTLKIGIDNSLDNWTLDKNGTVYFGQQIVHAGNGSPAVDLYLTQKRGNDGTRYAVLVDTDSGPYEGYIWRSGAQTILAKITVPRLISEEIFWSPDGKYAIVTDGGRGENALDHTQIYIINLQSGLVTVRQIGPFKRVKCEQQLLEGQPGWWVGDTAFRITVKIQEDEMVGSPECSNVKTRTKTVDVKLR